MNIRRSTPMIRAGLLLASLSFGLACQCGEEPPLVDISEPADTPEPTYDRGYWLDMDLDSNGRVYIAMQRRELMSLTVLTGTGDPIEWSSADIDGVPVYENGIPTGGFDAGYYNSIIVDDGDVPHISSHDKTNGAVRYSVKNGSSWSSLTVDQGDVGEWTSIGILSGQPIISYYDFGDKRLKVAYINSGGAWVNEVVDAGELGPDAEAAEVTETDVGQYSELLVDSSGTVWIAYYDAANGDLKVASGGPGDWSVQTWYGEGVDAGQWPRLSEHAGTLYVAFQDVENMDLLWGQWTGTELNVELIDDGDFVGADAAISWLTDNPVIMYHDGVNNDAKLARRDGELWTIGTRLADGAVGFHNAMHVGPDGQLNWVCFDHTTTNFVFQRFLPE